LPNNKQILKWGNSLAVRMPQALAIEARLAEGDRVSLSLGEDGSIVLRSARRNYQLRDLVAKITPKNRHGETDWGKPEGRESW
jgi:antitoxin MazE